jgi:hypothetical protein
MFQVLKVLGPDVTWNFSANSSVLLDTPAPSSLLLSPLFSSLDYPKFMFIP